MTSTLPKGTIVSVASLLAASSTKDILIGATNSKDDILSLNSFVDRIYPIEPEIKDATNTDRSTSYLDLHLEIDSEGGSK
jgi:hypothetical protein